jgi:hypothetical protein
MFGKQADEQLLVDEAVGYQKDLPWAGRIAGGRSRRIAAHRFSLTIIARKGTFAG